MKVKGAGFGEEDSDWQQRDRERDSRGDVTHNRSSHQDEFSTAHTHSEGARRLPLAHVAISKNKELILPISNCLATDRAEDALKKKTLCRHAAA